MKTSDRKRLEVWLTQQIHTEQPDGAPLRLFKVSHLVEGAVKNSAILEVHYRDQTETASIANQIIDHAQADCDAAGGVQKYAIKAQYGTTNLESRGGRFVLRLKGESEDQDDELGLTATEVSGRGVLSMIMRHQEGTMKLMVGVVAELMGAQQSITTALAARLEKAETRSATMFDLLEKAASERTTRELEIRKQLRRENREDMAIQVATKVLLPKLLAEHGTPDVQLEALVGSMTEDQIEALGSQLRPDQLPVFIALMRKLAAKKQAEENKQEKIAAETKAVLEKVEHGTATVGDIVVKEEDAL